MNTSALVYRACTITFLPTPTGGRLPIYRFEVDMARTVERGPFRTVAIIKNGRVRYADSAQTKVA